MEIGAKYKVVLKVKPIPIFFLILLKCIHSYLVSRHNFNCYENEYMYWAQFYFTNMKICVMYKYWFKAYNLREGI